MPDARLRLQICELRLIWLIGNGLLLIGRVALRMGDGSAAVVQLQSSLEIDLTGDDMCGEGRGLCSDPDRLLSIGTSPALMWVVCCRAIPEGLKHAADQGDLETLWRTDSRDTVCAWEWAGGSVRLSLEVESWCILEARDAGKKLKGFAARFGEERALWQMEWIKGDVEALAVADPMLHLPCERLVDQAVKDLSSTAVAGESLPMWRCSALKLRDCVALLGFEAARFCAAVALSGVGLMDGETAPLWRAEI